MRLLVTRPEPDGRETAAQLEALGHAVILEPVSRIAVLPPPDIAFRPAAIAFTSRNGVRAASGWPQVAAWREVPVFAVGEATARAAGEAGFTDVRAGAGDVAGLVTLIASSHDSWSGKMLHIAGRDRAGDLEGDLAAKGFAVVTIEAYAAVALADLGPPTRNALETRTLDGALLFSRRAATIFGEQVTQAGLGETLDCVTFYAISDAAAAPMRAFATAGLRIAPHPDAKSLIALIGR